MLRPAPVVQPQERSFFVSDFTGGLDVQAIGMSASPKTSPDACNVDWIPDGGWELRRSVRDFAPSFPAAITGLGYYEAPGQPEMAIAALANGQVWSVKADGTSTLLFTQAAGSGVWRTCQANGKLYLFGGASAVRQYAGGSVTEIGSGWSADLLTPTHAGIPQASFATVFNAHLVIADTYESGTRHPNRVRVSHPLQNQQGELDFRELDSFECAVGKNAEAIQGLTTAGEKCFVMKEHSIFEFAGDDPENFAVAPISSDAGAAGPEAWVVHLDRVWAFDSELGLHYVSGYSGSNGIDHSYVPGPLNDLIRRRQVRAPERTSVCAVGGRVLVTVELWSDRYTYAYDVNMKCWTRYDLELGPSVRFATNNGLAETLAGIGPALVKLNQPEPVDLIGGYAQSIRSWVSTTWLYDQRPAIGKLWGPVEIMWETDGVVPMTVEATFGYDQKTTNTYYVGGPEIYTPFTVDRDELAATPTEIRRPGASPTEVPALSRVPVPGARLAVAGQPTVARRIRLGGPSATCVRLLFRGPSGAGWKVRGWTHTYTIDPRRC